MTTTDSRPKTRAVAGLSRKFFWYSLSTAVLGIVATLVLSNRLLLNHYERSVERDLIQAARAAIRLVDTEVHTGLLHARGIGQTVRVHDLLHGARTGALRRPDASSRRALVDASALELDSSLTASVWHVSIHDMEGVELVTTRSWKLPANDAPTWWRTVLEKGVWVGTPYVTPEEDIPLLPIAMVAECLPTRGPEGIVRIELNWQNVIDALAVPPSGFPGGYSCLVSPKGRVLTHPVPSNLFKHLGELGLGDLAEYARSHDSGVVRVRQLNPRTRQDETVYVGIARSAGGFDYAIQLDWWVAVAASAADVRRDVYASLAVGVTQVLIVVLLLIFGVHVGTRRILSPLSDVTESLGRFGQGKFDERIDIHTGDEIEVLANTFNDMAQGLHESRDQLEAKIRELFAANENLKEMARLKAQLIANVSHELRTPLHSIVGFTELTLAKLKGSVPAVAEQNLERVRRNAYSLMDLVNQILDFSKLESGKMTVQLEAVDVNPEIARAIEAVLPLVAMGVRVVQGPAEPVTGREPLIVKADRQMVQQILMNLLSNAVKFTEKGEIRVWGERRGESACIVVRDTGVGIDPANQKLIFDEFRQVDGSSHRKYGGTGLGLSIVKRMSEMLGGRVEVESRLGGGSTFTVTLPVAKSGDRS